MRNTIESYNPATGELLGCVNKANAEEIRDIVIRSRKAQKEWAELSVDERINIISKAGKALLAKSRSIGTLLSKEMGKDYKSAIGEVSGCAGSVDYVCEKVKDAIRNDVLDYGSSIVTVEHLPLGVCAIITPWNYPVSMGHWMIIPALCAGNSVILKPSEETPLVAEEYVKTMNEVLPENLLQIVQGEKEESEELVKCDIDMIGFTGSMEVGKAILRDAAEKLIPCMMELGGNDPLIVLSDADVEAAAGFAVSNALGNAGQVCISTERIFVHESIYDSFSEIAKQYMKYFKEGSCDDKNANIGPMINEKQRQKVISHIDDAIEKGAKVLYGGSNHPEHFVRPTLLCDCREDMKMFREETFGPVVCTMKFADIDEAVQMANDSPYGLGASVFGYEMAEYVANRMEAGMVGINQGCTGGVDTPWTGMKGSAYGYHGSPDGHRHFTKPRVMARRK